MATPHEAHIGSTPLGRVRNLHRGRALDEHSAVIASEPKGRNPLATIPQAFVSTGRAFLVEAGGISATALEGLRKTGQVRRWWPEYVEQCLFLIKVTTLPVMLIAIPLGATISLQVGQLTRQLGAESLTGARRHRRAWCGRPRRSPPPC